MNSSFPSPEEIQKLTVHPSKGLLKFYSEANWKAKEEGSKEPARVLVTAEDFLQLVDLLLEIKLNLRELRTYSSRLKIIPGPVHKGEDKTDYYVYPDHFEAVAAALTLRKVYHLPLKVIQPLMEAVPQDQQHIIMARALSPGDLMDLAKMGSQGFALKDLFMAKACDTMLQDVLPTSQALTAATEPGSALESLEKKLILARLEEIKAWVNSGRRQEFVRRESAQDLKDLAHKHLIGRKISRKILARRARQGGGK